jgi:hypothetical protein
MQGGQDYFRFVEGTCIIALCLSSFSLSVVIRCILVLNFTSESVLTLLLISVFSLGENEEKANTIQPPFLVFFSPSVFSELTREEYLLPLKICRAIFISN